jgi:lysozyme
VLEGIDVSHFQGIIDWRAVASAGKSFAFIRMSDAGFRDPRFAANWAGAKAAGLTRSAYQFFRPAESPVAQADLMLSSMGPLQDGDLPPTLDVETLCARPDTQCTSGTSPAATADAVSVWVDRVSRATGMTPILYTSPGFWAQLPSRGIEARTIPFISHWNVGRPSVPGAWKRWAFWQYTDKGQCPGIQGTVDLDRFEGNAVTLRLLTRGGLTRAVEVGVGSTAILGAVALGAVLLATQIGKK